MGVSATLRIEKRFHLVSNEPQKVNKSNFYYPEFGHNFILQVRERSLPPSHNKQASFRKRLQTEGMQSTYTLRIKPEY